MRVIAGVARGRRLKSAWGGEVRPMTDMIREALFSTIGPRVTEARVLDLYSGSGAVGIEALSRGAAHATFVEKDPKAVAVIRANLGVTGFDEASTVISLPVESFLARDSSQTFGLLIADPPFRPGLPPGMLGALVQKGFVGTESLLVIRVSGRHPEIVPPSPLRVDSTRKYGDSTLVYMSVERGDS